MTLLISDGSTIVRNRATALSIILYIIGVSTLDIFTLMFYDVSSK